MAKKMSKLDLCWKNCVDMWAWIADEVKGGNETWPGQLKEQWCDKHGFIDLNGNCFFCEYCESECDKCPGCLVDPSFYCMNDEYDYCEKPIAFNNKIRALNRKRLKK